MCGSCPESNVLISLLGIIFVATGVSGAVSEGEFIIILGEALRAFETVVEYFLLGANVLPKANML
jgi:hypothetical protein